MANNLGLFGGGLAEGVAPPRLMSLLAPGLPLTQGQEGQAASRRRRDGDGTGGGESGRGGPCSKGFGATGSKACRADVQRGRELGKRSLGSSDHFKGQDGSLDSAVRSADKRQVREAEANFKSDDMIHQQLESINKKMEKISADLESKEK